MDDATPMGDDRLRLLAQDPDDLLLLSAALQDAVVKLADISYAPAARTLTFPLTRFRWEADGTEQVSCAVQFGDVLNVKARGLDAHGSDKTCSLLQLEFMENAEPPGGHLLFLFAGCGELKVEVECVDAALADLGDPWKAEAAPDHGVAALDD